MKKLLLTTLLSISIPAAFAAPIGVGGSRAWNQDAAFIFGEDAYQISYTTGDPLLKITQIEVTIGDGVGTTLFTDPTIGPPGYVTFGFGGLSGSASGAATVTDQLVDGDGYGAATFAPGWFFGQDFNFSIDTDHNGSCGIVGLVCDHVTGQEFVDYGGISFTLHFEVTDPNYIIVGPSTVTVANGGWTSIQNGLLPADNSVSGVWRGSIDVVSAVPEPSSMALIGFGLAGLGFIARRKRQ